MLLRVCGYTAMQAEYGQIVSYADREQLGILLENNADVSISDEMILECEGAVERWMKRVER